jgi:hypothetical protein
MFLIQDSVVVAPDRTVPETLPLLLLALWQIGYPWLVGKLTQKWNQVGEWLATKDDMFKRAFYVAVTFVGLQLGKLIGVGLPDDATVWGATAIGDVLTAIFGTLMAAIGIQTAKANYSKAGAAKYPHQG